MVHPRTHARRTVAALVSAALLPAALAGLSAAPAQAAAKARCPTAGAKVFKKQGSRIVFTRKLAKEGTVYYACSKTYRRTVRLDADASSLVDVIFTVEKVSFSGNTLTFRSCEETEDDRSCQTVVANLKTGKKVITSDDDGGGDAG